MSTKQRALKKTAIVIAVLVGILIAAQFWPAIIGWALFMLFVGMFVAFIFGAFLTYEEHKDGIGRS